MFEHIKIDDVVTRNMCGCLMELKVSEVTDDRVVCGPWEFCRKTGLEIDEDLGWPSTRSGSFLLEQGPKLV